MLAHFSVHPYCVAYTISIFSTDAAAARRAVLVVHDAGEAHQPLAGRPDARDAQSRHPQLAPQPVLGRADRLAPVMRASRSSTRSSQISR